MPVSRNVKIIYITNTVFGEILSKHFTIPSDTRIRTAIYHPKADGVEFLIEHESFPVLYEGETPAMNHGISSKDE